MIVGVVGRRMGHEGCFPKGNPLWKRWVVENLIHQYLLKDSYHVFEVSFYKNLKGTPTGPAPWGAGAGPTDDAGRRDDEAIATGETPVRLEIRKSELSRAIERKSEHLNLFICNLG
jgi:hypothetical protein